MCWTPSQFFLKPKHLPSIDSRIITKGDERSSCISAFTAYYFGSMSIVGVGFVKIPPYY